MSSIVYAKSLRDLLSIFDILIFASEMTPDILFMTAGTFFVYNAYSRVTALGHRDIGHIDRVGYIAVLDIIYKLLSSHLGAVVLRLGRRSARCGMQTTPSAPISSSDGKSVTYAATFPPSSAASISAESTRSPLAKLSILTPSFIIAIDSLLIKPLVSGVSGT